MPTSIFDHFLGSSLDLCPHCMTGEGEPPFLCQVTSTSTVLKNTGDTETIREKPYMCIHCKTQMDAEEVLERDDLIYIALMTTASREVLRTAASSYIQIKKASWDEAQAAIEKASEERAAREKGENG
jgi:hypothetical protein